jgi:hypothetical protein
MQRQHQRACLSLLFPAAPLTSPPTVRCARCCHFTPHLTDSLAGSDEGPWNHSFRLEHKLGPRLKVVALIDPGKARADAALKVKRESFVLSAYKDTVVYPNFGEFVKNMKPEQRPR